MLTRTVLRGADRGPQTRIIITIAFQDDDDDRCTMNKQAAEHGNKSINVLKTESCFHRILDITQD